MQKYATAQSPRPDIIRKWFNFVQTSSHGLPGHKSPYSSYSTFLRPAIPYLFYLGLLSLIEKGEDNQRLTIQNKKNSVGKKTPANTAMINPKKKGMHKRMGCKPDGEDFIKTSNAANRLLGTPSCYSAFPAEPSTSTILCS